ncbi:MAG: tRNA threonylcarbamoyladenosine dehydratase [Clostridia bacterium]|nr:tRNA threonylcarbamoyladenosine dehydratase [Clostridia bacterium]
MEDSIYQRTEIVIGRENINKLKNSHVLVCGIGGVGSYALEAIARSGVGNITIIDKDIVDVTNINRQLIALESTVGKDKVKVAQERLIDIHKEANIKAIKANITSENINQIIKGDIDYVVDAVDNIEAKVAIITECSKKNIKCISCMGMGNKLNPLDIKVADIYKTSTCPLAKCMRRKLKDAGIKKQKVVFSTEIPVQKKVETSTLGSVSFVPSVAGLIMASEVIKDLLK